jgi:hypothetical protein
MTKSKTQTQLVSKFLTPKQLKSLQMIDGNGKKCQFEISYQKKDIETFETKSGGDDVIFGLRINKKKCLDIYVGNHLFAFSELETTIDFDNEDWTICDDTIKLIKSNIKGISANKGENQLYREREKLMRAYEHLKSEIATYENNIGFLSTKNKKGSGVIREMERKIEALKEEAKLIEQKVSLIEETL